MTVIKTTSSRDGNPLSNWDLNPTRELHIDIETYSPQDLRKVSVYRYTEDPEFQILMAAWALDDNPVQVAIGRNAINSIPYLWDPTTLKVAHNAAFERICFSAFAKRRPGDYLDPSRWHDTMAVAAEKGYPQKLSALAEALGGEKKDEAGTALINWFCKPDRNGNRRLPEDHPEKWAQFVEYCRQDVVTSRDAHRRLGDFPTETERQVYLADQAINDRGMAVDVEMARAATAAAQENRESAAQEVIEITGVENPGSGLQMHAWFAAQGNELPDLTAETITAELARATPGTDLHRVLELRQELALVAAKKYPAALAAVSPDGRLRGGFRFFGAHTGRWAGRGVQPHNLPREQFDTEAETDAAILDLKMGLGASAFDLKAMVRALFPGPLTVVDYAAIEARVIAWLAGEEWALQAFRDQRDIYVETANRMSSATQKFQRKDGKVAVLALGYNGGVNSLRAMGANGKDEDLQKLVYQWRDANPAIVEMWAQLGRAFVNGGPVGDHILVERDGTTRGLRLPSGRSVVYHGIKTVWEDTKYGRKRAVSFVDPRTGYPVRTYGGRLAENVTQAVARDVLAEALVRLVGAGYPVVAHVHDEILVEGRRLAAVSRLMTEPPAWAGGLPIGGAGFVCRRYRKD